MEPLININQSNLNTLVQNTKNAAHFSSVATRLVSHLYSSDAWIDFFMKICSYIGTSKVRQTARLRLETRQYFRILQSDTRYSALKVSMFNPILTYAIQTGEVLLEKQLNPGPYPTRVTVVNEDTLKAASNFEKLEPNDKIAFLDLANEEEVCGSFNVPFLGTQEEWLATMSLLYPALENVANHRFQHGPLIPQNGSVYIPNIPIIRNIQKPSELISSIEKISKYSIIAVAALDLRKASLRQIYCKPGSNKFNTKGSELTKMKMRSVLRTALKNGITHLVLGAMGCGAFKNSPEDIANLWKEVIHEPEFQGQFKHIQFAVLTAKNIDIGNTEIFNDILVNKK